MLAILERRIPTSFLAVGVGLYGDGRVPAYFAIEFQLIWHYALLLKQKIINVLRGRIAPQFNNAVCYSLLLLRGNCNVAVLPQHVYPRGRHLSGCCW